MRFLQPSRLTDLEHDFDRTYPILAALRRTNARLANECEHVWQVFDSFAQAVVDPIALDLDATAFDNQGLSLDAVLHEACRRRIFSLSLPRSLGGQGASIVALSLGLERLARSCLGIANLLAVHGLALGVLGAVGALSQLRQIATAIVEGERRGQPYLLSTAATEPEAGTDIEDIDLLQAARLRCEAKAVVGGWKLSGSKVFVSNGSLASAHVVIAPTDINRPVQSLSAFLVERDTSGLEVVRVENKLGQRACPAAELRLSDCFVPESHKLNHGTVAGKSLDLVLGASRASVAAFGAGTAAGALDDCRRVLCESRSSAPAGGMNDDAPIAILSQMWQNARLARGSYLEAVLANASFGLTSLIQSAILRQLDRFVPPGFGAWATSHRLFESQLLNREARRWLDHLSMEQVAAASAHASAAKVACSRLALENCELAGELLGPLSTLEFNRDPEALARCPLAVDLRRHQRTQRPRRLQEGRTL